jgi:ubiquitin-protein ligase
MSLCPVKKIRRIVKEIKLIESENNNYISLSRIDDIIEDVSNKRDINLDILIYINLYNDFIRLNITIPNFYPFRRPKVKIKNRNYLTLLSEMNKKYIMIANNNYDFKNLKPHSYCLCCQSILCNDSWSPTQRLYKIVKEIDCNFRLQKRITELIMCEIVLKNVFKYNSLDFAKIILSYI